MVELGRSATIDGVQLAWDRWTPPGSDRDATPLLLVHGFSGSSHDFALQIERLATDRPVVAVDHRGHGRSSKLGRTDAYSIDILVADLAAFVDAVIGRPVDLLGHSMGGYVATWVVVDRPELVRSLILMDTSAWGFRTAAGQEEAAAFLAVFDPALGPPPAAAALSPEHELIAAATPAEWRAVKAELDAAFDPYALKALGLELLAGDVPSAKPRLGEVAVPVTVMAGEHDHPFVDQAAELAGCFADCRLAIIGGAYHSPQLTHAAEWRAIVAAHLSRLDP